MELKYFDELGITSELLMAIQKLNGAESTKRGLVYSWLASYDENGGEVSNKRIQAIKEIRDRFGYGLKEARDIVLDYLFDGGPKLPETDLDNLKREAAVLLEDIIAFIEKVDKEVN